MKNYKHPTLRLIDGFRLATYLFAISIPLAIWKLADIAVYLWAKLNQ